MLSMAHSYMILEEKLNTYFDNPASVDANSSRSTGKEFHRWKDESDQEIQVWYDKYTPLNASREKIYQDHANIEF